MRRKLPKTYCVICGSPVYFANHKTCSKECSKAYQKAYRKTDKWKAYQKAYHKTDKYKAYQKAYQKAYYLKHKKSGAGKC